MTARARRWPRRLGSVLGALILLPAALYGVAYLSTSYSGLARSIVWMDADVDDYRRFPARTIDTAPPAFRFSRADAAPPGLATVRYLRDGQRVTEDLERFLASTETTAFIVLRGDELLYERYFNGSSRDSVQTSFSVAKAFLSTLVGLAIEDGSIGSLDDPITDYVPELARRDERFRRITLRHLITMSSGLRYEEQGLPWSDDAQTYYGTDLRDLALTDTEILEPPGRHFVYNNFNPLLIGLALERAVGRPVAEYLSEELWKPLGMEADGSWSLDSERSGFEKMESGINARAVDFAKLGRLFLNGGRWEGRQVVPAAWVEEATAEDTATDPASFFQYWWWVRPSPGKDDDFWTQGNKGQFIYVSPRTGLVLARFGRDFGYEGWPQLLGGLAGQVSAGSEGTS